MVAGCEPVVSSAGSRVVCITGMHRSGTSLGARLLQLLGVSLGDEAMLMPAGRDNVAGYWENRSVRELDDLVLAELGGSWDQPPTLDPGWQRSPRLDSFRAQAGLILDEAFGPDGSRPAVYGWKDPRLSLLLPFWETVAPVETTVVVVRDPAQVADSLHVRNGFGAAHSAALWLRYVLCATAPGRQHLLVAHHELVADVAGSLQHLASALGLPAPTPAAIDAAQAHLDPSLLHHHRQSTEAGGADHDDNPVVELAARVFAGGRFDTGLVDPLVADALRSGWLRAPGDAELLQIARARAVELEERLRHQKRRWDAERRARGVTA